MGDYLEAAKQAWTDSLNQQSGGVEERRLQAASAGLALIATAEALRALVGILADIPTDIEESHSEEGWRDESRD